MDDQAKPEVVVPTFCDKHRRELIHRRLRLREDEPWLASEVTVQIMTFTWITAGAPFHKRTGGRVEDMSLVLAEIGCMACFDHEGFSRAARIVKRDLTHAAKVARGEATDPDWPLAERIAERIAELKAAVPEP